MIGKAEVGKGAQYWVDGKAAVGGECAINSSGGLIAKGHPVGATGVAMIGWAAWQLLGKVPAELQVKNARAAATFNIGARSAPRSARCSSRPPDPNVSRLMPAVVTAG